MSAFLDETGTLITVDHSNHLPVALVAGFTSLNRLSLGYLQTNGAPELMKGSMDNFKFSNGIARY